VIWSLAGEREALRDKRDLGHEALA
jgi:hypothetical protein